MHQYAFLLVIEIYDLGQPELSNQMSTTITVNDLNDNSPVFNDTQYSETYPEDLPEGSTIISYKMGSCSYFSQIV